MGAGLKHSQQVQIYFWFLLLAFMARKECSQQHFLSVLSFSKHQIWCPSPLGWNGVNCLAKKWGGAKARSAISYIPLISTFSLQPKAFWNWCSKHAFIFKILFNFQKVLSFSKFLKGYSCFKAFKQTFEVNCFVKHFVSFMKFNIDNNRANFIHSTCLMRSWYCSSVYHLSINIFKKWI